MDLKPIQSLLDEAGRLTKMPSKRKKRLYALAYLADKIPEDRKFTEKEFTEFLNTLHTFGDASGGKCTTASSLTAKRTEANTNSTETVSPRRNWWKNTADKFINNNKGCPVFAEQPDFF